MSVNVETVGARTIGAESLDSQSKALHALAERLGPEFEQAVELILRCKGRTAVCGIGKSGLVGRKIAATLASTGTPSFFLHPAEAFHGDLGMLTPQDLLLLLSYSGETEEVVKLIPSLKGAGNTLIAITGNPRSLLGRRCDVALEVAVEREVCPNNLAPTTSALVTMAMGDALACALMQARDFKPMDFARFHPGGALGRRLLTRVSDLMRTHELPIVAPDTSVQEALFVMTKGRLGTTLVMAGDQLVGIVTDGDLRRALLDNPNAISSTIGQIMTRTPVTIRADAKWAQAEDLMRQKKIKLLVAVDEWTRPVGILEIFDN
jgi:arabinose-5-phosphate isomerase